MENNTINKNEYSILGKFPLEPKFHATYNFIKNSVSFFEVSPDNSTIIAWSRGLYCLDANLTVIDFTEWEGSGSLDSIAFSPNQKNIAGSVGDDIFVFDLLNDINTSNKDRKKYSDYNLESDKITIVKFIDDSTLLTGDLKGTLSIIDINGFIIKHTKYFDSEIRNIEYSLHSGLLAIGCSQMVTVFSIKDNWKKIIEYEEFNKNDPRGDIRKYLRDVKFNGNGNLLAVSFSRFDSNQVGGSEITILDCLNNFSVYKSFIPNAKKLIQGFYPNEEFEFPFDLLNDVNIDFLNFKNDTTLLLGILFANSNHKKLNYGEPEEFGNYLLVVEMDIVNDVSKIIFSQRDHGFSNSMNNQIKTVGSNSLVFKCDSKIAHNSKEEKFSFLVKIGNDENSEQIPDESLASMLKKVIKTEEQHAPASINSAKSEAENKDEIKQWWMGMNIPILDSEILKEIVSKKNPVEFISNAATSYKYLVTENCFIILNVLYQHPGCFDAYFFDFKKIKSLTFTEGFIQGLINPKISFYYNGLRYSNLLTGLLTGAINNLIEFRINETDAEVLFKHLKRKTEKKIAINEIKINTQVKSEESKETNSSESKNTTRETNTTQSTADSTKSSIKSKTSKQKKNILIITFLVVALAIAGFFIFKYFAKNSYRKAVSFIAIGDFQQARYYADNCYTAINNQELELTFEEKNNLDLVSDIANSLQKFSDFKNKFPYPTKPQLSQNIEIFKEENTKLFNNQNLFAEIPIKRIIEKTSVGFDVKKIMSPFIKYADSLNISCAVYMMNDSLLLAIKTLKLSPNKGEYSWYEQNVNAIIIGILDKEINANKIRSLQAKLKIFLNAINGNIKKREETQKKTEQDLLQEESGIDQDADEEEFEGDI